ncbi:MAG: hypothetical protein OXB86_04825 [Bdellovibrionales bacterium]|nr:hypothetical protein [Bdellovibrionales bacterium]
MKDEKVKKLKDKNTKNIVSKKKRFSLVSPIPQSSLSASFHSEEEKTLVPLVKDSSNSPSLDLNANLLLLEQEAAFFHFALKEVHDLTG